MQQMMVTEIGPTKARTKKKLSAESEPDAPHNSFKERNAKATL